MTFLFDIGRVLLDFDFESSLKKLLPPNAQDGDDRLLRLLDRKDDFESGNIAVNDYIDWALEILGSDATRAEFCEAWQHIFTPNPPMWDCVRKLAAAGHRLILFSNTNAIHCPWIFEQFPGFSVFDGQVLSFEVGSVKPEPPIYQAAIDSWKLIPQDTLYIDDLPANIETGRRFGFRCWQYEMANHSDFENWLAREINLSLSPTP